MICRLCKESFEDGEGMVLSNMPAGAQSFLKKEELATDKKCDLKLMVCPHCGMIQLVGEPVPYYRDCIRACGVSPEMAKEKTAYYRDIFEKYGLIGKSIVEIGCGGGEFLKLIEDAGADAYGIEHKKELVEAAKHAGYQVREGYVGDVIFQDNGLQEWKEKFDGFTCTQFLEHAPNPDRFLRGIADLLKEDAVGIVEVPNFDMMQKELLFTEFISDHLLYFTENNLCMMLEYNGFEVLECAPHWHDYVLSAIVRKKQHGCVDTAKIKKTVTTADFSGFKMAKDGLIKALQTLTGQIKKEGKKLAIWGASHQALAIIGMSEIESNIEYIVDSAPFKQGFFTPGTHLLVVEPKYLEKEPVDVVIVMAASYNKEVVQVLKRDYPDVDVMALEGTELVQGGTLL